MKTVFNKLENHWSTNGLILYVLFPSCLALCYWIFIYTPVYSAEVILVPQKSQLPVVDDDGGDSSMSSPVASNGTNDAYLLREYIASPDLLAQIEKEVGLQDSYSAEHINFFQRLSKDASFDTFHAYHRKKLRIILDPQSAILKVEINGFDPELLLETTHRIVDYSEAFLNTVSRQLAYKQIEFIERQVELAASDVKEMSQRILEFQHEHEILEPDMMSSVITAIVSGLEKELSSRKVKISSYNNFLSSNAYRLDQLNAEVDGLKDEIEAQRKRLSGDTALPQQANNFAGLVQEYNRLVLDLDFAVKKYTASFLTLKMAQANAAFSIQTVVVLSQPETIENPTNPKLAYWGATAFVTLFTVFGLFRLGYDSIVEHA